MLKLVFSISLFLLGMVSLATGQVQYTNKKLSRENFILILNSYCYENAWGTALTKQLQEEIELINPELITRVTYARLDKQQSFLSSRLQMQSAFTKGRLTPDVVCPRILVLVGEESWMLYRIMNLRGKWEQIPVVLCGVHARILEDYADYFRPQAPSDTCYISTFVSIKQLPVTGILKDDVSLQNLQLFLRSYPGLQEVAYLSSGGYSDCYELQQLRRTASEFYPDLRITEYNTNKLHPDSICLKLNTGPAGSTAVVFNTVPSFLSSLTVPVFSLQDQAFDADGLLGGFYASTKQYARQTAGLIRRIYEGEKTDRLPFMYVQEKYNYLNRQLLEESGIFRQVGELENSKLYNTPSSFLVRNQRPLLLGVLGILIFVLLYRYYVRSESYNREVRNTLNRYKSLYKEYQLIFNHMPVSMLLFDGNGRLLRHNSYAGLQRIFPFLADVSCPDVNLFDYIPAPSLCTKIRNQEIINLPVVLHTVSRERCYFRFLVRYLSGEISDDKQILVVLIDNQEIYEQRNIRRKLMQALDFAMDKVDIGVANYDWEGQQFYFTSNWLKNLDLKTRPVKLTDAYKNLSHEDYQSLIDFLQDMSPDRPLHYNKELPVLHKDGSLHWLRYQIGMTGFHPETGSLVFTEISRNINQSKFLEEELYNAMLKAQRSERLKNAFIANMGHEIRTPLNAIVGFSNLLCETEDMEIRQQMVRQIEENNEIMLRLIHDIIDLSKIETGSMDFNLSSVNLPDLFNDMAVIARMKATQKNIEVKCEFPEEHFCILTDKVRLKQVLTNFINNAVKFTEKGQITLGYRLQNDKLYGFVKDTGIGISQDKQKQVFERFFREHQNYKGFGLGLSISRSIIEGLDGEIGVKSKEGEGAEFWFCLPVQEVSFIQQEQGKQVVGLVREGLSKHNILVVEDNESNYLLLQFILKDRYNLIHAWNGEEALELFRLHSPDLILMDIKMPKMNGYEATSEIRKYSTQVPIIATTAYALSKDEEEVLFHGFDGYLAKPLQKKILLDTISYWLARRAS